MRKQLISLSPVIASPHSGRGDPAGLLRRFASRNDLLGYILASLLLICSAFAQSARWDPPSGQLGYNQVSELSLIFDNCEPELDSLRLPTIDGLQFGRPSQRNETSIINGRMSHTFSLAFPVRPTKRSTTTIPAFTVKTDKGDIKVPAASYTVGDATVGSSGANLDDIATAKLTTPKSAYWVGEIFPITYNLNVVRRYFHSLGTNIEWNATPVVTEDWTKPDPNEALVRGERQVVSAQSTQAYAKQAGTYTLKPASQMVNLVVGTAGFGFFSQPNVEQRAIETNPLTVTIKPLPPAPAGFSGAVGEFTFKSKIVPLTAAVGEPVTWTLELAGTGNWPDITGLPSRDVSNDFQVVQPKSKRTMKDGSLFTGTLSEDVVLVPTKPGSYQLAAVRFTYFDTKTGTYQTITSDSVTVNVTAQPAVASRVPGAPVQFSIAPTNATTPASAPTVAAVPPTPPENLPRDPITTAVTGLAPWSMRTLTWICIGATTTLSLLTWFTLAALRSRETDPQRRRREAHRELVKLFADSRLSTLDSRQIRAWQSATAILWEIAHAAPNAAAFNRSPDWTRLWAEADRAQHSRETQLPADWPARAASALQAVKIPGWNPLSLFGLRNLFPFLIVLGLMLAGLPTPASAAANNNDAYAQGDFSSAEKTYRATVTAHPTDWTARHNLGLALAQQDRWAEATAQWTSAFLLNSRAPETRWDLALGLQKSGLAPAELVSLARGEGRYQFVRLATPGEWQIILVSAALLLAAAIILLLLQGYRRIGGWGKPTALITCLLAMVLAAAATLSLHTYGPLAEPNAVLVWNATTLRSIPTEADTTQKTSPLSAGSIALIEKSFLGWTKLRFPGDQAGWVRSEELVMLYR